MTIEVFNDAVEINGSQDIEQLKVKANSTQTEALQEWQDSSGNVLSEIDADGYLLVGDEDGTIDALLEAHNIEDASKPSRGFHAKGILSGTLNNIVSWVVQELGLTGDGALSALHRSLRVQATNENVGVVSNGAEIRAGDFEVINQNSDEATTPENLKMSALVAKVNNQSDAILGTAYGLKVEMVDDGSSNELYAIHTDNGIVHLGDVLELEDNAVRGVLNTQARSTPPTNPVEGDRYLDDGTNTASGVAGERAYLSSSWVDIGGGAAGGGAGDSASFFTTGTYTTSSGSYVDMDATNLNLTLNTSGGDVLVGFSGGFRNINHTGREVYVSVNVDGSIPVGPGIKSAHIGTSAYIHLGFTYLYKGLSAGSHTFKIQWLRTISGTENCRNVSFWAKEIA